MFETLFKLEFCLCIRHKRMFETPSNWSFACGDLKHSRHGKPCVFTTTACLKHSRDGKACVFTTRACLKVSRDGKVFTTRACLKVSRDGKACSSSRDQTWISSVLSVKYDQSTEKRPGGRSGRGPSSPETNSMGGRVCVRKEGLLLRNYHHSPMSVHVPERAIDEEGEH